LKHQFEHLTASTAELLNLSNDLRIREVQSERWVHYPRAKAALVAMGRLAAHPRTTRMPSLAIYGDSGMGKTMLMRKFCEDHPPIVDPRKGIERQQVLPIQMAGKPGERQLFAQILHALGVNQGLRSGAVDMQFAVIRLLKAIGLQVLVIDEVHNILAGSAREQRIVLNTLRYLSNELNMSLVCFGEADVREAISGDAQLARRFDELTLTRWSSTPAFEELMISILRNLPLREPSVLTALSLRRILQITEGLTARIFRLMNDLAITAIENGVEKITDSAVDQWRPPFDAEAVAA
jgi:chromosomal replication initiation ATPase DnaA